MRKPKGKTRAQQRAYNARLVQRAVDKRLGEWFEERVAELEEAGQRLEAEVLRINNDRQAFAAGIDMLTDEVHEATSRLRHVARLVETVNDLPPQLEGATDRKRLNGA